jgi:hypothetical protein
VMSFQSVQRAPQQTWSYRAADGFRLRESGPKACRRSSQAGQRESEKRTTGRCQDVDVQRR